MAGLSVFPSEETVLQYLDTTPTPDVWRTIPGIASYRETGGDAPTREVVAFEATVTLTGRKRIPTIECDVMAYNPQVTSWRHMRTASENQESRQFRIQTKENTIHSFPATTQIAVAGSVVTFTMDDSLDLLDDQFAPGLVIREGTTLYIIDRILTKTTAEIITATGEPVSDAAAAAITGESAIIRPSLLRGPFAAKVSTTDRAQMGSESNLTMTLRLQPFAELPEWKIQATIQK